MNSFYVLLIIVSAFAQRRTVNVGLMFSKNQQQLLIGYRTSAGAVLLAEENIRNYHLLDNVDFNYTIKFDECDEATAAGSAVELITQDNIDVIIGPSCNYPAVVTSVIAKYYDVPVYLWGLTSNPDFNDMTRFPTTTTVAIDDESIALGLLAVMNQFKWNRFVYIYTLDLDSTRCDSFNDALQSMVANNPDIVMATQYQILNMSYTEVKKALASVSQLGRIIVICLPNTGGYKRATMLAAYDLGLVSDEYVYIICETRSRAFYVPDDGKSFHWTWNGTSTQVLGIDGRDEDALKSFKRVFYVCDMMGQAEVQTQNFINLSSTAIQMMSKPPFNCIEDCKNETYQYASQYLGQLHDAMYVFATILNKSMTSDPNFKFRSGRTMASNAEGEFVGVGGGTFTMGKGGKRLPVVYFVGINEKAEQVTYAKIQSNENGTLTKNGSRTTRYTTWNSDYTDESVIFINWQNGKPKAIPTCGFTGKECPTNFVQEYLVYVIIASLIIVAAFTAAIAGVLLSIRARREDLLRQDLMWQVPIHMLQTIKIKSKTEASVRSFMSGPSTTSTKITVDSVKESKNFSYFTFRDEPVAAMKHDSRPILSDKYRAYMRDLRNLDHDNLNKFLGLVLDAPVLKSVWRFCSRGSLANVIEKSSVQMDAFFVFSLIKDVANGLSFIHSSFLKVHGHLTSHVCLIDDRWQVKISGYGISELRQNEKKAKQDLLWTAPEILRNELGVKTKEGDVFSLAIICSELVTRSDVYDLQNRNEKPEEILYMVKKGGHDPMRPSLKVNDNIEVNPALLHLIRDCWSERPSERPTMEQVKSNLKSLNMSRNDNLMDHVFNMLESYASNLEEEVAERMKELVEEKKKSDLLLYRMLPKQVADKLKLGQSVEPETFDSVTIFFSDVVSFTTLASKCTPLQVVNLLNSLYTVFDSTIEKHEVYKVETIGDGYLCVSGLPHRNGNEHVRRVAEMSLELLHHLKSFRVPHLPDTQINIRIGMHCGSVVAGVVGLTMPRYCLFGDAVNTASRMESNGKAGQIHLSADANRMLTEVIGGFSTESRGEVIIKGKGVMETFWLLGGGKSIQGSRMEMNKADL